MATTLNGPIAAADTVVKVSGDALTVGGRYALEGEAVIVR